MRMSKELIKRALKEDLGSRGDVTSLACIPGSSRSVACMIAKEDGILCGLDLAVEVFRQCGRTLKISRKARDGQKVRRGQKVLEIRGNTRAILAAERTALNFVQRLSGIAASTQRFLKEARKGNKKVRILDTRKTLPTFRILEKYAVKCGGGTNHRMGLHDMVLIKDNHIAALKSGGIVEAVARSRKCWPSTRVEVECDTLDQVKEAIKSKADIILLDNMTLGQMSRAVRMIGGRAKVEASGGVTLKRVSAIARTGVDFISVGALTHSAPAMDYSLEISNA